jgi:hypothetical protein
MKNSGVFGGGASSSLTDKLLNAATVLVLVLVAATLVRSWTRPAIGTVPQPNPIGVGSLLKPLAALAENQSEYQVGVTGSAKVLYVFSTRCPVCTSQKSAVGKWLRTLPTDRVLTASREDVGLTQPYWSDSSARIELPVPLQLTKSSAAAIQATFVPYMIVTDEKGVVQLSHVGPLADLDTAKVRRLVTTKGGP